MENLSARSPMCPVVAFECAPGDYLSQVDAWLADPHAYFRAFGPEARAFQQRHRSERLRTLTLVMDAGELCRYRPVRMCVDGAVAAADSWESVFSLAVSRLGTVHPRTFATLQQAGALAWLGCPADGAPFAEQLEAGALKPTFAGWDEVAYRVQWLFLVCGIRLNEVIVQADPFTDETWAVRKAEIDRRRAEDKAFMEGRRAAQKAYAEAHPEETEAESPRRVLPGWA